MIMQRHAHGRAPQLQGQQPVLVEDRPAAARHARAEHRGADPDGGRGGPAGHLCRQAPGDLARPGRDGHRASWALRCPSFWVAYMLLLLFVGKLGIPVLGLRTFGMDTTRTGSSAWLDHALAPVPAGPDLSLGGIAAESRYMRGSMIDTMIQDYVRTARAKGLPEEQVDLQARPAQRPAADDHDLRPDAAGPAGRGGDHRDDLRLPGHRPAGATMR